MMQPHPRRRREPEFDRVFDEDLVLDLHEMDMFGAIDDPEQVPRAPTGVEEGVTELGGTRMVDIQGDTPDVDAPVVDDGEELLTFGLGELVDFEDFADLEVEL